MPLTPAKLQDIQNVSVTVPNGASFGTTEYDHNLVNQFGQVLAPSTIIPVLIGSNGAPMGDISYLALRSGDETYGTIDDDKAIIAVECASVNNSGSSYVYTFRVTSIRWHSIQGSDLGDGS
jgi:hypothetical protein